MTYVVAKEKKKRILAKKTQDGSCVCCLATSECFIYLIFLPESFYFYLFIFSVV